MKINILTEFYYPSCGATAQLITDLSYALSHLGHQVTVITSSPGDNSEELRIVRLHSSVISHGNTLSKAINGTLFMLRAFMWMYTSIQRSEITLVVSNPPFIGLIALVLRLIKNQKYVFLLQDLFPRSAVLSGILPSSGPSPYIWRYLIKSICTYSESNIVLSKSMLQKSITEYPNTNNWYVIHNWAVETALCIPKHDNPLIDTWNLDSKHLIIQYSGNFGRLHDILTILECARLLQAEPITFLFIGSGAKTHQIQSYIDQFNLNNIVLKEPVSRNLLPTSLALADISVLSIAEGAHNTVAPSKYQGIVASNIPVAAICSRRSPLFHTINDNELGKAFESGDVLEIAEFFSCVQKNRSLLNIYRSNLNSFSSVRYQKSTSISQYEYLLLAALNS